MKKIVVLTAEERKKLRRQRKNFNNIKWRQSQLDQGKVCISCWTHNPLRLRRFNKKINKEFDKK